MKQSRRKFISILIISLFLSILPVLAEEDSDLLARCSAAELSDEEARECQRLLAEKEDDIAKQLEDIMKKKSDIAANLAKYGKQVQDYNSKIAAMGTEIAKINLEITAKENLIKELETEIIRQEEEVKHLKGKVSERMVQNQANLHINSWLDMIMGASSFTDMIRRIEGMNDIMAYDNRNIEQLKIKLGELNSNKTKVTEEKVQNEVKRNDLISRQKQIIVMRTEVELVKKEAERQAAELETQGSRYAENLEEIKRKMNDIADKLGEIAPSSGWVRPASGRLSAGTWYYPGSFQNGSIHLGMDIANSIGTSIYAAGNGVILTSSNACPTNGYLGSTCGSPGSPSGGNQVYLLTQIDGSTYVVKYLHMKSGTPAAIGTIVSAGDKIGEIGNSGNSSGAHVHTEIFRVGTMPISDYVESWTSKKADLTFGTGWKEEGLRNRCSEKGSAPCREKPENKFN